MLSKGTFSKPSAGGPARNGGASKGGASGLGRPAAQSLRAAGGVAQGPRTGGAAGGSSAAIAQKDAQIQELNNEVCLGWAGQ